MYDETYQEIDAFTLKEDHQQFTEFNDEFPKRSINERSGNQRLTMRLAQFIVLGLSVFLLSSALFKPKDLSIHHFFVGTHELFVEVSGINETYTLTLDGGDYERTVNLSKQTLVFEQLIPDKWYKLILRSEEGKVIDSTTLKTLAVSEYQPSEVAIDMFGYEKSFMDRSVSIQFFVSQSDVSIYYRLRMPETGDVVVEGMYHSNPVVITSPLFVVNSVYDFEIYSMDNQNQFHRIKVYKIYY